MNEGGTNQPSPLAYNGTVFLNNTGGIVQALDGKTGDLIWEQRLGVNIAMRGMTLYNDKLYLALSNAHLVAINARTGEVAWDVAMPDGRGSSSGPLVAKGKVIQGMGGCQQYVEQKCFISAYDAETGKQLWRFNTVAKDGEPGGNTWGSLSSLFRAGGETWITGSYDPDLNLTFWGTAQAKPWMPVSRGMYTLDKALYTSSTLALDVDTGKLAWYYSHAPGEALDLDIVFERVLVDSGGQNLRVHHGQGRRPVEARSQDGQVSRTQRGERSRTSGKASIRRPVNRATARTSSTTKSASGSMDARAPRVDTTGRR